ncbi:glycosyltransferase [Subtercola sp. Z020]|uniref:glycosyltransferase n=1 Tax=Subtercola sp. Z020 TaxID=2080582 RepID=UPI00130E0F13|nr:glycosyltransferase [Subtercola sp. Z020]
MVARAGIFRHNLFVPSETFIRAQAGALSRYSPTFIARRAITDRPEGVDAVALSSRVGTVGDALYGMTGTSRALNRLVAEQNLDIVHAHFGPDGLYAVGAVKSAKVPLVVTLHGRDVTVSKQALIATRRPMAVNYALRRLSLGTHAELLICVSDQIRQSALALGLPENKLLTHYIGVDTELFAVAPWPRPPQIIHVARLVEKKGTADLISAFAAVAGKHSDATLRIIGDGPLMESLVAQVATLGLTDRVVFLGRQSEEAVRREIGASRIFALPSVTAANGDREGLPIALVEAMSLGTAVVSTRHSGIPEAVSTDTVGILVAEHDVDGLAASLDHLLGDEVAARALGLAAAAHVASNFDLVKQTQKLESLYDSAR